MSHLAAHTVIASISYIEPAGVALEVRYRAAKLEDVGSISSHGGHVLMGAK